MASIILGAAGSAIGGGLGSSVIGAAVGRALGGALDSALFDGSVKREGARLEELSVQTSTYGKMIPQLYGSARIAGNIIWSRPIREVAETTETSIGGKGGGGTTSSTTRYSYFVSLAIAICEGEIDEVLRIWADSKLLDLSQGTYRIYKGTEGQLPDSYIESFEGVGTTPAYRGLAYVVVEDFPLEAFGNRIPNFTFEVKRKLLQADVDGQPVEEMIQSMIMIPGAGEFVYDDTVQYKLNGDTLPGGFAQSGNRVPVNMHNPEGKANALYALDQLADTCPNLQWVGVVVTWFGDHLDAGLCEILPGVEYQDNAMTIPDSWQVGSYTRSTARQITLIDGTPRYGGTPSDASLLRYLQALKDRGYQVMLFPMFFMDVADKPWRGRVTGSAADVADFFTKSNGYNAFINHYANLAKDHVDAFVIGSELIGLTKVHDGASVNRHFPAVDALVNLAATVKGIVGSGVQVTYAADWSEYHHTEGGWYNLDPLWASANIDFIGIDAYFPLTDTPQGEYEIQEVIEGWTSGEGYDWYYSDAQRTTKVNLQTQYAWKNIDWWWNNSHINPDGNGTGWVPQAKKIWFTEYGFPSVDGATNQPNVFYDPNSQESFFPYHSKGQVDFLAQRTGIAGTEAHWAGSGMVERLFLWTWDARPYPYWPDLRNVWADGDLWKYGHWVNGKLGLSGLAAIVANLCQQAGLSAADVDVTRLQGQVEGFIINRRQSVRECIEQLMGGYFFDAVESDNQLKFVMRGGETALAIAQDNLLAQRNGQAQSQVQVTRAQEAELPQQVSVLYINRLSLYQTGHQIAQRQSSDTQEKVALNLPIVMGPAQAQQVAEISLYTGWMGRTKFSLQLPPQYLYLEPTDIIEVTDGNATYSLRITRTTLAEGNRLRVEGVAEDVTTYRAYEEESGDNGTTTPALLPETELYLLDMPLLPGDDPAQPRLRAAATPLASGWNGAVLYRSADNGQNYNRLLSFSEAAVTGAALDALEPANPAFFDRKNSVTVNLLHEGNLASADEAGVLNGANAALLGDEVIQFKTAALQSAGQYRLSGLLRGRLGTEWAMNSHEVGERFVLLDNRLAQTAISSGLIGLERRYKGVTAGATLGQTPHEDFTYQGVGLKPYAPVHLQAENNAEGDITFHWMRRSRVEGSWRDEVDVPVAEENEAYEVEILDGQTVVRVLESFVPSVVYPAAQQEADFGAVQSAITAKVYQISALVGRGYAAEGSFTMQEVNNREIPLSAINAACVFDLDATLSDSYDGTGQTWANLIASPADGASQTDYDHYLGGSASVSTDDPTFNGSVGDAAAYWGFDGGDYFEIPANTSIISSWNKTTGGTDFTLLWATKIPASGRHALFRTGSAPGWYAYYDDNSSLNRVDFIHRDDSGSQTLFRSTTTRSRGDLVLFGVGFRHGDNTARVWSGGTTADETTLAIGTSVNDATGSPELKIMNQLGGITASGTELYGCYCFNKLLSDSEFSAIKDQLEIRHNRSYV